MSQAEMMPPVAADRIAYLLPGVEIQDGILDMGENDAAQRRSIKTLYRLDRDDEVLQRLSKVDVAATISRLAVDHLVRSHHKDVAARRVLLWRETLIGYTDIEVAEKHGMVPYQVISSRASMFEQFKKRHPSFYELAALITGNELLARNQRPRLKIVTLSKEDRTAANWESGANCHQEDPELFFSSDSLSVGKAVAVCRRCDVREDCLKAALEEGREYGVWGGLSERERRRLKRKQAAAQRSSSTSV